MPDVRVIKFDVGSATDKSLNRVQTNLDASTAVEAFRRSIAIADRVTEAIKSGHKVLIEDGKGNYRELLIG